MSSDDSTGTGDADGREAHRDGTASSGGSDPDDPVARLDTEGPVVPTATGADVDPKLKREFWTQVILFNVALLGTSLGLMLVGFEGRWRFGGAAFAVGVIAFARGWSRYRAMRKD